MLNVGVGDQHAVDAVRREGELGVGDLVPSLPQPAAGAAGRGALFFIKSEGTGGGFGENRRLFVNFFRKSSFFFAIPGHLWYATLAFLWARFLFNKSMYFSSRFFYKRDLERMFQILWV